MLGMRVVGLVEGKIVGGCEVWLVRAVLALFLARRVVHWGLFSKCIFIGYGIACGYEDQVCW